MSALATDIVTAKGHPNVRATHKSTLEVTREKDLTPRGDCIIAVAADKAAAQLNPKLLSELAEGYHLAVAVEVEGDIDVFFAQGFRGHKPTSTTSIVIRKSTFRDERTLAVKSTKAAKDIDRGLIEKLANPAAQAKIYFAAAPTRKSALKLLAALLEKNIKTTEKST